MNIDQYDLYDHNNKSNNNETMDENKKVNETTRVIANTLSSSTSLLRNLCFSYQSRKVSFTTHHCSDWFMNWTRNGFFHQGKLYLFDLNAVHIIDSKVLDHLNEEFDYITIQYSDWIKC